MGGTDGQKLGLGDSIMQKLSGHSHPKGHSSLLPGNGNNYVSFALWLRSTSSGWNKFLKDVDALEQGGVEA